ncbi:MAG: hypothetical protein MZW92_72925 [Comamonadaceae bacterium]|nr:hypothetical protein [Comamonadaceae bacterium]
MMLRALPHGDAHVHRHRDRGRLNCPDDLPSRPPPAPPSCARSCNRHAHLLLRARCAGDPRRRVRHACSRSCRRLEAAHPELLHARLADAARGWCGARRSRAGAACSKPMLVDPHRNRVHSTIARQPSMPVCGPA